METRSRKRAEAAAQGPLTRGRLARLQPQSSTISPVPAKRARLSSVPRSKLKPSLRGKGCFSASADSSAQPSSDARALSMEQETGGAGTGDLEAEQAQKLELQRMGELDVERERGKEKESDRDRERMRLMRERAAAAAAVGGLDDDMDGDAGVMHHNLASASSALNGLLRRLGAGLDELLPSSASASSQNSRLKNILSGLRAEGDEGRQLEALSQLCEHLSIGTEESLSSFSVDSFVPVLVGLLNCEYSPDMMLLAARALTHLCDVLPSSCAAVVHYGAVACFCSRLLTIEYIDLAEQSLQALSKISQEHPAACLRAGGLMAVLSYLDFFSTGVQRVAVSTAANICRQLPSDAASLVMEAVPILTNLLQYQDSKVVEHACVCLSRIAESFASSPDKLDVLCSHGLLPQAVRLVSVSNRAGPQTPLSSSTYTGLIRLLATCAGGSATAAESLLHAGISGILRNILAGSGSTSSTTMSTSALGRPAEQVHEIVSLMNELLPPVPEVSGAASRRAIEDSKSQPRQGTNNTADVQAKHGGNEAEASMALTPREKLLVEEPVILEQFGTDLFPILLQVYGWSINPVVRYKSLSAMCKLVHFSTPDMLRALLQGSTISSFLAGVLSSKDATILNSALQLAEMLMQKLPEIFGKSLVKEGVVHAIDALIASELPQTSVTHDIATSSASAAAAQPPRPRRSSSSRRRGGHSQSDAVAEEAHAVDGGGATASAPLAAGSAPVGDSAGKSSRSSLRAAALTRARQFRETYFLGKVGSFDAGMTDSLRRLKELCGKLGSQDAAEAKLRSKGKTQAGVLPKLPGRDEQADVRTVGDILAVLAEGDGVSTFEFVGSGAVDALVKFFSVGGMDTASLDAESIVSLRRKAQERLKRFIDIALDTEMQGADPPMTLLVRKLQSALSSLERFPVIISQAPRTCGAGASISAGLSALTQPFKLRLTRANSDKVLRDYSSNVVLIEPLATLAAVEDFLWTRVKRHEPVASAALPPVGRTTSALHPNMAATGAGEAAEQAVRTGVRSTGSVAGKVSAELEALDPDQLPIKEGSFGRLDQRSQAGGSKDEAKPADGSQGAYGRAAVDTAHVGPVTRNAAARLRALRAYEARTFGTKAHDPIGLRVAAFFLAAEESAREESAEPGKEPVDEMQVEDEEEVEEEDEEEVEEEDEEEDDEENDQEDNDEDEDMEDDDEEVEVYRPEAPRAYRGDGVHDVRLGVESDAGAAAALASSAAAQAGPSFQRPPGQGLAGGGFAALAEASTSGPSLTEEEVDVTKHARKSFAEALAGAAKGEPQGAGNLSLGGLGGSWSFQERRSAAAVAASSTPPKLVFSLGGKTLDRSMTIFQAIQHQAVAAEEDEDRSGSCEFGASVTGRRLWDEIYTITYRRLDSDAEKCQEAEAGAFCKPETSPGGPDGASAALAGAQPSGNDGSWRRPSLVDVTLAETLPCSLDKSNPTYNILLLLHTLDCLNQLAPRFWSESSISVFAEGDAGTLQDVRRDGSMVAREEFLSRKLTSKLARQLQDAPAVCSGGLPSWCHQLILACPFLFPFETRRQYFYSTAFGLSRALQRLQQQQMAEGVHGNSGREPRVLRVARLPRQKVRVSRNRILDSAAKVMELYSGHKAVLEVEYFGEVGTGLGPTLEFYTLLSHELQKRHLQLWRTESSKVSTDASGEQDLHIVDAEVEKRVDTTADHGSGGTADYVTAPMGLFPRPWKAGQDKEDSRQEKVVEHFLLLGRVMAKALQDGRLLDLPFSTAFYKLVLGQELDLYDIKTFDPELGNTMEELWAIVCRKKAHEARGCTDTALLHMRGCRVEDLCLDFTLPGHPDYALKPGGSDVLVTLDTLEEYVELVVDATLRTGIEAQMRAFRAGFNQVFPLSSLQIFSKDELDALLCGRKELWKPKMLSEHIKFDHGYTASSDPIRNLLEIMQELTPDEQRSFLRFVTGAPRLPPGGLASLTPRLTIVRKHPTGTSGGPPAAGSTPPGAGNGAGTTLADGDLPSVMTCANYLKLPPYSCKVVMKERLLYAINEGQGSFDLS